MGPHKKTADDLRGRIQAAQLAFVAAASRLVDEAAAVKRQRDELMELLTRADRERNQPQEVPHA